MASALVDSIGARIQVTTVGGVNPATLVAACQDVSLFETVSFPFAQMDLRGQSKSTIQPAAVASLSLKDYVADFDAVLKHMRNKAVTLISYSQAAFFATHYAALRPQSISKLVLIEPALYTEREELIKRAEIAERGDGDGAIAAMLRYVEPRIGLSIDKERGEVKAISANAQSPAFIAAHFRVRANNPITARHTRRLTMPVLLIGGTASHLKDAVVRAAREIEEAAVWWVRGAQHLDIMSSKYAKQVGPVIDAFVAA
jgi:pimeloyl-ACP methyl ester carboxylesterase